MLKALPRVFVSAMILLGMQTASAAATTIVHEETKTGEPSGPTMVTASASPATAGGHSHLTASPITPQPVLQFTLTVNTVGAGTVTLDPPGGVYSAGTVVTLTPQSGAGHQFTGWSEALGGSANPATIAMTGNKNVTANFKANAAGAGPVVYEGTRIGSAASSTTVTTFATVNAVNGHLYLAAISTQPKTSVLSVSGLGLNWTLVRAKCSGRNTTGIEVWMAQGVPQGGGSSNVTATLAQSARTAVIAVSRYSGTAGVNPIGNVITGNTTGMNTNATCSGGADNNAYSFNLDTNVDSAVVYGAVAMKGLAHAADASYIERAEVARVNGNNAASVAVQDKAVYSAGGVAINGSLSGNTDWVLVALEIKPKPPVKHNLAVNTIGSGSVALDPAGGIYNKGTVVTLTATPAAGFQFNGWSGDLSGSTNPATVTMNSDKDIIANFTANTPGNGLVVHEETKIGGASGSTTVTTSAHVTAVNGNLYLAAISTQPKVSVVSVSGLGLNWALVRAKCSGRNTTGIEVWMAQGIPQGGSSGNVTATFANAAVAAVISVSRYSGTASANPIGNTMAGNTTGINTNAACSGGADNNTYAFNLNTTVDNAVVFGAVAMKNVTHTPAAGYAERSEVKRVNGSNVSSTAVENKTVATAGSVTVNGSFSGNVDWVLVALEIKPEILQHTLAVNTVGSGSVALDPPGGTYSAGTEVTLTATPAGGSVFSGWSGALSGAANPTAITMTGDKNVTATFVPIVIDNEIVHQETKTGGSADSTKVATSANVTAVNGHLYLAAISTRPSVQVTAIAGLGLSWSLVKAQCSGRDATGVEVWMAQGTPSNNGLVTATLAGTPSNAVIAVSRYSGVKSVNPIGNVISGNTNGVNGLCADGADTNLYAFNLTTTTSGSVVYGAVALRSRTHTPGVGYTERADFMQGTLGAAAAIAVEDKTVAPASTVAVSGTLSGDVDWAMVALEIKPPLKLTVNVLGSGSVTLDPPGGIYTVGTEVTLTATPAAGFEFSGWSGDLSGAANPATIAMNAPKNVTAIFTSGGSGGHVALEEVKTGTSVESITVATSGNLTGVSGHLYLAAISTKARLHIDSVTGLGLSWSLVDKQCAGRGSTMVEVWMALGTPSSNGPVTAHFPDAPTNAVIAVSRYSGVYAANPLGNVVSFSTNGEEWICTGGTDTDSYSYNLTTTTNDAVVYAAVALRSRTHTPGAGYTEHAEISEGTPNAAAGLAVMDGTIASVSTVAVNGLMNGITDWSVVAVEIKPQANAGKRSQTTANENLTPPADFQLEQNYPNPFSPRLRLIGNPGTTIGFALPVAGKVVVKIYTQTGQLVRTLVDGEMAAGRHTVRWNGRNQFGDDASAGIYLYQIVVQDVGGKAVFSRTQRMIFLK